MYQDVIRECEAIKDSALLTESMMFYSQVLTKQNKFKDALKVSNDALALARKINTLDMVKTAITRMQKIYTMPEMTRTLIYTKWKWPICYSRVLKTT